MVATDDISVVTDDLSDATYIESQLNKSSSWKELINNNNLKSHDLSQYFLI